MLVIGVAVGGVLAMAGMLFAFAAAQAALYVMAVIAAPLAVAGVLRHMRWLRSLWIKAAAVLALLPVAAGGIFKAGVALGAFFAGGGLLSVLIRLLWLWGATGFLLALAGILGRVTLSAGVEALGKLTGAVKAIAATAVLAGMAGAGGGAALGSTMGGGGFGAGSAGLSGPGAGLGGQGGGAGSGTGTAAGGLAGGGREEAMLGHLDRAQGFAQKAGTLGALGLHGPAGYARTQARLEELSARKLALEQRLARFAGTASGAGLRGDALGAGQAAASRGEDGPGGWSGFSESVGGRLRATFPGSEEEFQQGFRQFSPYVRQSGLDPGTLAQTYPEDTARMVHAYLQDPQEISGTQDPLLEAARRGKAQAFLEDVFGTEAGSPDASQFQQPSSSQTPPEHTDNDRWANG
jgi:hypothetical protein